MESMAKVTGTSRTRSGSMDTSIPFAPTTGNCSSGWSSTILVSNDDDHLRNHGFIHDPRLPGWRLSPLYDVLPRPSSAHERYLHLGIGPQGRLATLDNAFDARDAFGLSKTDAGLAIAEVWQPTREWKTCFEERGVPGKEIDKIAPAFRHIDDVSHPTLRKALP